MSQATKIEWTQATWNPVTGCTKISPACEHCYAERMTKRLAGRCGYPADEPFRVTLHPDRMEEPFHWWKPRTVFVVSMGDLFHPDVTFEYIERVFAVMAMCREHTFQVLTKRAGRMHEYILSSSAKMWSNASAKKPLAHSWTAASGGRCRRWHRWTRPDATEALASPTLHRPTATRVRWCASSAFRRHAEPRPH